MEIKKELEVSYADYKNKYYGWKKINDSYNKEKKTIKLKIPGYAAKYGDIDRIRKIARKRNELEKKIPARGEFGEICIGYFHKDDTNYIYIPCEIIDEFIAIEKGNFSSLYACDWDSNEITLIALDDKCEKQNVK